VSFFAVALLLFGVQEPEVAAEIRRAESFWRSGKAEEARTELEKVRERAPSILLPLLILARVDGAESEELKRLVPEARTRAVLLQNAPMEGEEFVPLERPAIVLASVGDLDRAITEYRAVAEVDPSNVDLHRHMGNAFFKAARNVEAVEAFEHAVALEPRDAASWGQLGSSRLRLQWWDKAIEAFEKARSIEGDKPGGLFALGYAWERKPDFEKALDFYERASKLSPSWAQPPYRRGRTLLKLDRLEDAERELKQALELDPKLAEARCFLGALYLESHDLAAATRELELSVSQAPRYAKAHFYLGQAYLRAGRREEAQAELARFEQITREVGDLDPP
jgi:tetratricopeptide (TPR) repeat protein